MTPIDQLRIRYLQDPLPRRWGAIASDLLRISALAKAGQIGTATYEGVLVETKLFTEWIAGDAAPDSLEILLDLQRSLARWAHPDSSLEAESRRWSDIVLGQSGLV